MPLSKLNQVVWAGFTGFIAVDFEPRVLQDGHVHRGSLRDDQIHFRNVATPVSLQLADAHHGAVLHATIELLKAELQVSWAQIDRTVSSVWKAPQGSQHSIVFLSKLLRGGMAVGRVALGEYKPLNTQT